MTQQNGNFQVVTPSINARPPMVINGVLYGCDALVAAWVSDRLAAEVPLVPFVAFGVCKEGTPEGVVQDLNEVYLLAGAYWYNHYNGPDQFDITVAVAADDVAAGRPDVIRKILQYPFGELKVPRITGEVAAGNERAIRTAEKLGFKIEGTKRKAGRDGSDMIVLGLLPEECPLWRAN